MTEIAANDAPDEMAGILYVGAAYSFWGLVPLYWRMLFDVNPIEITIHRILWCALFAGAVTLGRGRLSRILGIFGAPKTLRALTLSSLLIAANWTVYIWCVSTHQLVEAALGYYLTPLISIALGVILLREHISRFRLAALAIVTVAVAVQAFALGHIPWIAPALALSFGFYGYVRKRTEVDALDGLTVETWLLFPFTLALVGFWAFMGTGAFPSSNLSKDALLIGAGPLTAVPLVMFAAGARKIRLTTLGFLQYLSPTITLIVATLILGELFTRADAITFCCVWTALALVGLEGRLMRLIPRGQA